MKILSLSDLHIRLKDDNRYRTDLIQVIRFVLELTKTQRPDYVMIGGDLFDTKHPTMSEFSLATAFVKGLLLHSKVILIAGNHDEPNNTESHNTLQPLANLKIPGLYVLSEPGLYALGDIDVLALPYLYQDRDAHLAQLKQAHDTYTGQNLFLLAHLWVPGFGNLPHAPSEFTVTQEYLTSLTKVKYGVLGHIHIAGEAAPRIYYNGSPYRVDWGETEHHKSLYLWEDGKLQEYITPVAQLITCDYDAAMPTALSAPTMIKIRAHNVPFEKLVDVEALRKSLEAQGHTVKVDLALQAAQFTRESDISAGTGFNEFFTEYINKQMLDAEDRTAILDICNQVLTEKLTKKSSPFDLTGEDAK